MTVLLVFSNVLLFAFSICLLVFIVFRRHFNKRNQQRFRGRYKQIETDVLAAFTSDDKEKILETAERYKIYPDELTQVILDYVKVIAGTERTKLELLFDASVKQDILKDLYSRNMIKRLKAARIFVIFSGPDDIKHLLKLLNDKPLVRLTAINALSQIYSVEAISRIFQTFEEDKTPNLKSYFDTMFGMGDRIESYLKVYMKKDLSIDKLCLLIDLAGYIPLYAAYPEVQDLAEHESKEIRIHVARSLGNLTVPDTEETLIALSKEEIWEVKSQAIVSLGKLKTQKGMDILTEALYSPIWYIRLNAGQAMAKMGDMGIDRLFQIAEQKKDKFAAEMASMVLDEMIIPKEVS
ncbi:HEAT repeat domain-containing protein [Acidobacteriota bacterium]